MREENSGGSSEWIGFTNTDKKFKNRQIHAQEMLSIPFYKTSFDGCETGITFSLVAFMERY